MDTNNIENINLVNNNLNTISWKIFYNNPETIKFPFYITVVNNSSQIKVHKILRLLPKKRICLQGNWNNSEIIIKIFFQPGKAKKHQQNELTGINLLAQHAIPTPELIYQGHTKRWKLPIIITKYIPNSKTLLQEYLTSANNINSILHDSTIELATQHVLGIIQKDLHFANLLIQGKPSTNNKPHENPINNQNNEDINNSNQDCEESFSSENHAPYKQDQGTKIITLDGSKISAYNFPLNRKKSLKNLALFFSQLNCNTIKLKQELLEIYTKARGWKLRKPEHKYFTKLTTKLFKNRLKKYQNKVIRNCSFIKVIKSFNKRIWINKNIIDHDIIKQFHEPENIIQQSSTKIIKKGRSTTVTKVYIQNKVYIIKRYNIKNAIHWLRRCFRSTRAICNWKTSHILKLSGIATPTPIACIENRLLFFPTTSYFIMQYIPGDNLIEYIKKNIIKKSETDNHLKPIAKRIIDLIDQVHNLGLCHGDLKATNFIISNNKPILIDLDGVKKSNQTDKDINRFMQNWHTMPKITELFSQLLNRL